MENSADPDALGDENSWYLVWYLEWKNKLVLPNTPTNSYQLICTSILQVSIYLMLIAELLLLPLFIALQINTCID